MAGRLRVFFIAALFVALLFFTTLYIRPPTSWSSLPLHHPHNIIHNLSHGLSGTEQKVGSQHRFAFATFLGSNTDHDREEFEDEMESDGYFLGTRVLGYQLMHSLSTGTNQTIPFVVVCTTDVSSKKRRRLEKDGAVVVVVDKIDSDAVPDWPRWIDVFTKLRMFELTDYTKIAYMDADIIVVKPLHEIFHDEATHMEATLQGHDQKNEDEFPVPSKYMVAAHIDYRTVNHTYPPDPNSREDFNSGFMVFSPSKQLFQYYLSVLKNPKLFHRGGMDQGLLNYAHRHRGNMPWKKLNPMWNTNWPAYADFEKGVHSFHTKPWLNGRKLDIRLLEMWQVQREEMRAFYRGRDSILGDVTGI